METVEELIVNVTSSVHLDPENCESTTKDTEMDTCQKTNGIAELKEIKPLDETTVTIGQVNNVTETESVSDTNNTNSITAESDNANLKLKTNDNEITTSDIKVYEDPYSANVEEKVDSDSIVAHVIEIAESTTNLSNADTVSDNVTFETEILIEKNDDTNENKSAEHEKTNNILNELGQNIGLSEALCSSESVETPENNNSHNKHQVLNNEELLDILEGNDDIHMSETVIAIDHPNAKSLETQLALQQLSRLKTKKRKSTRTLVSPTIEKRINRNTVIKFEEDLMPNEENQEKAIKSKKKVSSEDVSSETHIDDDTKSHKNKDNLKYSEKEIDTVDHIARQNKEDKNLETNKAKLSSFENLPKGSDGNSRSRELKINNSKENKKNKKKDNIVNVLVQDWDDDELMEEEARDTSHEISANENTNELDILQEDVLNKETISKSSVDSCSSPTNQEQSENTSKEEKDCQSQKRQSRVIKKKVIFDPDNPDTFTKSKAISKIKEIETEHQPAKKIKVDQSLQKSSLKSPTSKLKWKKPAAAKSNKQNKRLSEVDRLLMDEGAVNMIYQLTPEAPKGKKNVRTKAEFIKKLQSSTPDGKEMKFRERKKESKDEDEAKRIIGEKKRMSLSSSVKSPSACEDFETHSADDSIIYRRHSSSSYSSTGMSPRRPSEVDSNTSQNTIAYQKSNNLNQLDKDADSDVFMSEITDTTTNEIIKKEDCVSLKEKLNSKLAQALKTKKRDSVKNDKPSKRKKNPKLEDQQKSSYRYTMKYDSLTITVSNRLAEICIRKTGTKKHYNIETLKELDNALEYIENKDDISITLVTSQCGSLCSDIDLRHLLVDSKEKKINSAHEIAEAVRSLLCRMEQHNKLLCTGVWGACSGVGLAMVALSDMVIASEHATFSVGSQTVFGQIPPLPGIAVLTMQQSLSQSLVNDLVVFGRRLAASEALRAGLVSRVLWPNRFVEQLRALVNDVAAQPPQSLLLKKQLLRINKSPEAKTTFLTSMEAERDMLAEYWTSFEGQEMLRTYYDVD